MVARMRNLATDLSSVLEADARHGKDAPPLALAYRYAVERRDEEHAKQEALLRGGVAGGVGAYDRARLIGAAGGLSASQERLRASSGGLGSTL